MIAAFPPVLLAAIAIVALLAGLVNGVAGFGFALVGTMVLATVLSPATAVVLLIVPLMAVNIPSFANCRGPNSRGADAGFGRCWLPHSSGRSSAWYCSSDCPKTHSASRWGR